MFNIRPEYLSVAVLALMMVETSVLICAKDGFWMCRRSLAMRLSAVLSSTITQSALSVSRFRVSSELYGCTTTSLSTQAVAAWGLFLSLNGLH